MRILVIGSPGSGKTTFSKQLSHALEIPLVHLDDCYWKEKWQRPGTQEWQENLSKIVNQTSWIIDGNYSSSLSYRMKYATHVIYLDYPITLCLYRAFKRAIKRRYISKDTLPVRIRNDESYQPKIKLRLKFIKLIALFKIKQRKYIFSLLEQHNNIRLVIRLESPHYALDKIKQALLKANEELKYATNC